MAATTQPLTKTDNTYARHAEIARRYAWQAQQRRRRSDEKPDPARLITLIRLRELERLFQSRYGRFLPADDAGLDDLMLAAHHIAQLRGEISKHIVDWARAWAPWLPHDQAEQLAERVAAEPRKFTADALAWRLRLSMTERTSLKITTIGAFDVSKTEREEERKRKRREAERARRAKHSSGRLRGRPRKMRGQQGERILVATDFRPTADAAREVLENGGAADASTKENQTIFKAAQSELSRLEEGQSAVPPSTTTRAASPQKIVSTKPPPDVVAKAVDIARQHSRLSIGRHAVQRIIDRFWPGYVSGKRATAIRYYGSFRPDRDLGSWAGSFRSVLDHEADAIDRYRGRRRKWTQQRRERPPLNQRPCNQDQLPPVIVKTRVAIWRGLEDVAARIVRPPPGFVCSPDLLPL